jgi:secreted trypsin-like serine protease
LLGCALALLGGLTAVAAAASPGGPKARPSIVGGKAANPANWPFAAAVLFNGQIGCGGSVLAPTKVLTAAHCAYGVDLSRLTVVTGRPNLADPTAGETSTVASAAVHPSYADSGTHDLAVLTLTTPTSAAAATPASASESAAALKPGKKVFVAGWGSQKPAGGNLSSVLKQVALRALRARFCLFTFGFDLFYPQTMLCAQGTKKLGNKRKRQFTSACRGDSGGPVVANTPAGVRLVAVVSFGPRKCGRVYPAVYAKVAAGADFIAAAVAAP